MQNAQSNFARYGESIGALYKYSMINGNGKKSGVFLNIGIAIPTYNEALNLVQLILDIRLVTKSEAINCVVVIIDDNSPDGTGQIAKDLSQKFKSKKFSVEVLHRPRKEGLGRAYIAGLTHMLKADYDYIMQMDADSSHDPRYIASFIAAARDGADFVVGSRYISGGATPDWKFHRKLVSYLGNLYVRVFMGSRIHDYTGGYNLYSAQLLRKMKIRSIGSKGYGFAIEVKVRALVNARKVVEFPIVFHDRKMGVSKIPKTTLLQNLSMVPKLKYRASKQAIQHLLIEVGVSLMVAFASLAALAHIAQTGWKNVFLYNGDSLTLPIIGHAISEHEPIRWVFSSQMNLFPEGPMYWISSLFVTGTRQTLALNAVLNIVLYYIFVRLILAKVGKGTKRQQIAATSIAALLLLGFCLLESYSLNQNMASYSLFTTYYFGLVISGLSVLLLTLHQVSLTSIVEGTRARLSLALILLLTCLTVLSNPLYIVQFVLPLLATFVFMYASRLLSRIRAMQLVALQLTGTMLGLGLRQLSSGFIGQSLSSHSSSYASILHVSNSVSYALGSLAPAGVQKGTILRVYVSVLIYFFCLFFVLVKLNRRFKRQDKEDMPLAYFVLLFVALQPIILAFVTSLIGGVQNRYFSVAIFMPLVGLGIILSLIKTAKIVMLVSRVAVVGLAVAVLYASLRLPQISPLTSSAYPDGACLRSALNNQPANGVSGYWTARALDVYTGHGVRVLQVNSYRPYAWLNNLATYEHKNFSFVVIPLNKSLPYYQDIASYKGLTNASKTTHCNNFVVYQYFEGTPENARLNRCLQQELNNELAARSRGDIAKYNSNKRAPYVCKN